MMIDIDTDRYLDSTDDERAAILADAHPEQITQLALDLAIRGANTVEYDRGLTIVVPASEPVRVHSHVLEPLFATPKFDSWLATLPKETINRLQAHAPSCTPMREAFLKELKDPRGAKRAPAAPVPPDEDF